MTRTVTFEHKGQMINYYNKVISNKKVNTVRGINEEGKYYVFYWYN